MRRSLKPSFLLCALAAAAAALVAPGRPAAAATRKMHHAVAAAAPAWSAVYPIQEGRADAHGVLIYSKTIGRGAPLVIMHGGPGASHDYFLPYLLPLARTNRLIFIDERGSGHSEKLDDPAGYTVENMVEDLEAVRRDLGL